MMFTSRAHRALAWLPLAFISIPSFAWDGIASGKITSTEITAGGNYAFRVYLNGGTQPICTNGTSFAFLNESDSNYKTYVASLLMAKAQGSNVTIFTTNEGGFCHIGHLGVGQ